MLPVLLLYLLLGEILDLVVGLATPIADLFPKGTFAVLIVYWAQNSTLFGNLERTDLWSVPDLQGWTLHTSCV